MNGRGRGEIEAFAAYTIFMTPFNMISHRKDLHADGLSKDALAEMGSEDDLALPDMNSEELQVDTQSVVKEKSTKTVK